MLKNRLHAVRRTWLCGSLLAALACGDDAQKSADPPEAESDPSAVMTGDSTDAARPLPTRDAGKASATPDAGGGHEADASGADAGKQSADAGSPGTSSGATGPDDGDPGTPVVLLPDIACGDSKAGFGLGTANLKVGGRDVILTYPCELHEGANVTFILLLHGTNSNEATKTYTHAYFAAHTLTNSHNLIIAEPKSLASQWGNTGENPAASADKQHLLDVIDYVYTSFDKLNINSTWIAGHSWGAIYAKQFVCDSTVKDRVRGVIGMSGGSVAPGGRAFGSTGGNLTPTMNCADYISQIHTVGDTDMVAGLPDQTKPAATHGCSAKTAPMDLGKMQMLESWPSCRPGWAHENITMGAHSHTTAINPEVVLHIIETVKATEKR